MKTFVPTKPGELMTETGDAVAYVLYEDHARAESQLKHERDKLRRRCDELSRVEYLQSQQLSALRMLFRHRYGPKTGAEARRILAQEPPILPCKHPVKFRAWNCNTDTLGPMICEDCCEVFR